METNAKIGLAIAGAAVAGAGVATALMARNEQHNGDLSPDDQDLRADLPRVERMIDASDGGVLAASRAGHRAGPTVVLAHCYAGSQQVWTPVARRLARAGCDVIRWDQRGHGRSVAGRHGHTLRALGDDLRDILAAYDVQDAVVAGHSMGGMTTLNYAVHHAEDFRTRTKALVLTDTAGYGLDNPLSRMGPETVSLPWVTKLAGRKYFNRGLIRPTFGAWVSSEQINLAAEDFVNTSERVRSDFAAEFPKLDLRDSLAAIDVPTWILVGTLDIMTPPRLARAMHRQIEASVLRVYPHMGHMLPLENPDGLTDAILAAIATEPSGLTD